MSTKPQWVSDGCTVIPDDWVSDDFCCCEHDMGYRDDRPDTVGMSFIELAICRYYEDLNIMMCLKAAGKKLPGNQGIEKHWFQIPPWVVFQGLRLFGWATYYF